MLRLDHLSRTDLFRRRRNPFQEIVSARISETPSRASKAEEESLGRGRGEGGQSVCASIVRVPVASQHFPTQHPVCWVSSPVATSFCNIMDVNPPAPFIVQFPSRLNIAPSVRQKTSNGSSPETTDMAPPSSAVDDKAKRLTACLVCRKRKLKCDSARPKCASCTRLGHSWYQFFLYSFSFLVAMRRQGKNRARNKDMSRNSSRNHRPSSSGWHNWRSCSQHTKVSTQYPH